MYREVYKDKNTSWDDISRQVYGTPEKAGDIERLNNSVESGNILVVQEENIYTDKFADDFCLEIGETIYKEFPEYLLIDEFGAINGGSFIFINDKNFNISFGSPVRVFSNSEIFLEGRIANMNFCKDNRAGWIQADVKSDSAILLESHLSYPLEFGHLSIKNILEQTAAKYRLKLQFSDDNELNEVFVNEIGSSFSAQMNESVYDFMNRVCLSRGLFLNDTGRGLSIGRLGSFQKEKINIIEGECIGVESIKTYFNTDGLARYYEINSQYPSTETVTIQIPYPYPILKRLSSDDFNAVDLISVGNRLVCREIGKHFKIEVVLNEVYPIKSGNIATVKYPSVNLNKESDWMVQKVIRKNPDKTILILTLPCTFTGIVPKELPLCS